MNSDIPELDKKGLRQFGLTTGAMVALLFGLLFPWLFSQSWPLWPWIVAVFFAVWALLLPLTLNGFYRSWMRVALGLGWINTRLILGLVFYLLIFPIGMLLRLCGKELLARHFDNQCDSYRKPSDGQRGRKFFERPF